MHQDTVWGGRGQWHVLLPWKNTSEGNWIFHPANPLRGANWMVGTLEGSVGISEMSVPGQFIQSG